MAKVFLEKGAEFCINGTMSDLVMFSGLLQLNAIRFQLIAYNLARFVPFWL